MVKISKIADAEYCKIRSCEHGMRCCWLDQDGFRCRNKATIADVVHQDPTIERNWFRIFVCMEHFEYSRDRNIKGMRKI